MSKSSFAPILNVSKYHLNFDGQNDKVVIPASDSLNNLPLGDFTIEWVGEILEKIDNPNQTLFVKNDHPSNLYPIIIVTVAKGDAGWRYIALDIENSNGVDGYYIDWPSDYELPEIIAGGYHHFEIVYVASTKSAKLFVDGIEQSVGTSTYNGNYATAGYVSDDSAYNLVMGINKNASPLKSSIRWAIISNSARHTSNFTPPSLTVCPSSDSHTVLRLRLDEGNGVHAIDSSGKGNNGTIHGATWERD